MTITTPDPTAVTDAAGNYSFTGLTAGTYQVAMLPASGDVQTFPSAGGEQTVTVADGQTAGGIDFGVLPASNLATESFYLSSPATSWGQDITINYTLTNNGNGDAPAFDVAVLLSDNGQIAASDDLLQTLNIGGLAADSSTSGSVTVTLPSAPPAGFGSTSQAVVGFLIDPEHALAHNVTTDDANQGLGIDEAALSVTPNQSVATGSGVQQDPSIAVDPTNPNHIVVAYMDSTLVTTPATRASAWRSRTMAATRGNIRRCRCRPGSARGRRPRPSSSTARGTLTSRSWRRPSSGRASRTRPTPAATSGPTASSRTTGSSCRGAPTAASPGASPPWWPRTPFTGTPGSSGTTGPDGTQVPFDSGPSFAIDTYKTLPNGQANPYYDDLYVAWTRVYPAGQFPGDPASTDGSDVMFSVSTDGGKSWQTQLQTQPAPGEPGNVQVTVIRDPYYGTNDKGACRRRDTRSTRRSRSDRREISTSPCTMPAFSASSTRPTAGPASSRPTSPPGWACRSSPPCSPAPPCTPDSLRTLSSRDIVADPSHPGRVYVVEADDYLVYQNGLYGLYAPMIVFAYSDDYGQTWEDQFQVGNETTNLASLPPGFNDTFLSTLNDADSGNDSAFDSNQQLAQEVLNNVALPSLAVDAQGQITVIWYDSRMDPLGRIWTCSAR